MRSRSLTFLLLALCLILPALLRAQSITPDSIITTIAGTGRVFRGNGGPATSAALGLACEIGRAHV